MKGKIIILIAITIVALFFIYRHGGKKNEKHHVKQVAIVKTDDSLVFRQLAKLAPFRKADSLYDADVYDSAIYYYNKAFTELTAHNNQKCKQEIFNRIGYTYLVRKDFKEAWYYLEKARTYQHRKDSMLVDANTYHNIGVLYEWRSESESDSALLYFNKAYNIYTKLVGENNIKIIKLFTDIGNVYRWVRSDYYNAEKYYTKALQIFEMQGYDKKENQYFNILYVLASTYRLKEDYSKSLSYGLQALHIANTIESQKKNIEICCSNVANIYFALKDYKKSIEYNFKALDISSKTLRNNSGNRHLYLNNLAYANYKLGNYGDAISYCKKAYHILHDTAPDAYEISTCYINFGYSYQGLHQWSKALENFRQNLAIKMKYLGIKHPQTALAYGLLSNIYSLKHDLDSAIYFNQLAIISGSEGFNNDSINAVPLFSQSTKNNNLINYLYSKANNLVQKYRNNLADTSDLSIALKCYELSDSLVSFSRKSMDTENSKLSYSTNSNELYEDAIACAYQLYQLHQNKAYIKKAFRFFERNKYLLLLEKLTVAEAANKAGIPDSLAEAEKNLSAELKFAQDKLASEQHKKNDDKSALQIQALNNKIFGLVRDIENLHDRLERNYPNYFKIKYQDGIVSLDDIEKYAKEKNASVIQYFWGKNSVYSIGISAGKVGFTKISNDESFKDCLTRSLTLMHEVNFESREKFREYVQKSQSLYELLVKPFMAPVAQKDSGCKNLVIIPDGTLSKLSYEALVASLPKSTRFSYKNLDYLIYHYNIQYAYSSHILVSNGQNHRERSVGKLLGFGYAGEDPTRMRQSGNGGLPGTVEELKAVSTYFRSTVYMGENASEYNFKRTVSNYDIVHLALHGSADEDDETGSRLIFRTEKDKVEDGMLYANEIYNLKLNAKLVVLSACETGIGKNYQGEGIFSMSRAFSYAGCPSIVISLWNVNDKSTSALMGEFYRNLSRGNEIGTSLRKAKLAFLKTSDEIGYQPVFWASFVAFGEMSPIQSTNTSTPWIVLIITLVGVFLVYWYIRKMVMFKRKKS